MKRLLRWVFNLAAAVSALIGVRRAGLLVLFAVNPSMRPNSFWNDYFPFTCLICVYSAMLPALWMTIYLHRRYRHLPGFCQECGYDLRATPDRCPECGAVAAGKAAT